MPATGSILEGKRILVTRPKDQAAAFSKKIAEHGGIPIEIPLIRIMPPQNLKEIERTIKAIFSFHWVVLTSVNGVHFFFHFLEKYNINFSQANRPKIAVVGKKTLEALKQKGVTADLVPDRFVAENLLEKLLEKASPGENILLARGNLARSFFSEKLIENGMHVQDLVIYDTVLNVDRRDDLLNLMKNHLIDIITFTSSSTVTNFVELLQETNWQELLEDIQIACIGPITEKTAIDLGLKPQIIAKEFTIAGLLDAIVNHYIGRNS